MACFYNIGEGLADASLQRCIMWLALIELKGQGLSLLELSVLISYQEGCVIIGNKRTFDGASNSRLLTQSGGVDDQTCKTPPSTKVKNNTHTF
jgi:hypothetical protein